MNQFVTPEELARAWGISYAQGVREFLLGKVKEVHAFKNGRGMMRLYDRDSVLPLLSEYKKSIAAPAQTNGNSKAVEAGTKNLVTWHNLKSEVAAQNAKIDALTEAVNRLVQLWEQK